MSGRQWQEFRIWELVYLVVTVFGLLTGIGFAVYGMIKDNILTEDSLYLYIFIVNSLFALVYTVKGMRYEDPYDLGILVLSVAPPIIYIIVDYCIGHKTVFKLVRVILGPLFALCIVGGGFHQLLTFWRSQHFLTHFGIERNQPAAESSLHSASSQNRPDPQELRRYVRMMLLFYFLISANLQIDLSAAVFTLTSGFAVELTTGTFLDKQMLLIFFSVSLVAIAACTSGYFCVRKEDTTLAKVFALFSGVIIGVALYIMIQSVKDLNRPARNQVLSIVALFVSVLMIFFRFITCYGFYLVYKNFGEGLVQEIHKRMEEKPLLSSSNFEKSDKF